MVAVQATGTSAVYNPFTRNTAVEDLFFTASPSDVGQKSRTDTAASAWISSGQSGVQTSTSRISANSMATLFRQQDSGVNKWNDAPTEPAMTGFTFDSVGRPVK
jgi:hypothetical protein